MNNSIEILELTETRINGTINRNSFEKWVDDNELREWVYNPTPGIEESGVYTWEEYYDGGGAEYDLYKYEQRHSIKQPQLLIK